MIDPKELIDRLPAIREQAPAIFIGIVFLLIFIGGGLWALWVRGQ